MNRYARYQDLMFLETMLSDLTEVHAKVEEFHHLKEEMETAIAQYINEYDEGE